MINERFNRFEMMLRENLMEWYTNWKVWKKLQKKQMSKY
jgi:hypothetical protein